MKHNKCNIHFIYFVVFIYTILQVSCLIVFNHTPYPDSLGYISIAKECVENNTFYPINLADIHFLWNIGSINAVAITLFLFNSIYPLLFIYCIMQGLSAWLIYDITNNLSNRNIANIALFLYVCYPATYGTGTSTLSETPFIFFSLLSINYSLKNKELYSGIFLAVANYFRPIAIIYLFALFIFYIFNKSRKSKKFIPILIGFCSITFAIGITNYICKGHYFTQGAMGWMGLMQYSWDNDSDKTTDYQLFHNVDPNYISTEENYNCLQRDSIWKSHFFIWLSHNKIEYLKQMPPKLIKTYISDNVNFCAFLPQKENREYLYDEISMRTLIKNFPDLTTTQTIVCINLIYYYTLLILSFLGFINCIRTRYFDFVIIPISIIILGTAMLVLVGHGEARFHQPFMPMIIILSSYYLYSKYGNLNTNKTI